MKSFRKCQVVINLFDFGLEMIKVAVRLRQPNCCTQCSCDLKYSNVFLCYATGIKALSCYSGWFLD